MQTQVLSLEEWYKRAERGTSGEMVYDILRDWKIERDKTEERLRYLACLEQAGVDNWRGIEFAQELFEKG